MQYSGQDPPPPYPGQQPAPPGWTATQQPQPEPGTNQYGTAQYTMQPGLLQAEIVTVQQPSPVDTHLFFNIMVALFCFWPVGLVGIYYSSRSSSLWRKGNFEGAQRSARTAKKCGFCALGLGIFTIILSIVISVVFSSVVGDGDDSDTCCADWNWDVNYNWNNTNV